jgi:hypothetical protein
LLDDDEEVEVPVKDIHVGAGIRANEAKPAPPIKTSPKVSPVRRSKVLQTPGALFMRSVMGSRASRVTMRANSGAGL